MKTNLLANINFHQPPKLNFVYRLTNSTGIIQHTKYAVPDRNLGYSVDDNARALIVACLYYKLFDDEKVLDLAVTYLSFVHHAKTKDNFFYNFLTFDNKFKNKAKTEDGFGRCFWALGYTIYANPRRDLTLSAKNLINDILPNLKKINSPRAIAYSLAGLYYLALAEPENQLWKDLARKLGEFLIKLFSKKADKEWAWFEDYLTYANGVFPYALLITYQITNEKQFLEVGQKSLEFLDRVSHTKRGLPSPIGSESWFFRGKKKSVYDQQPLEASDMVIAFLAAYKVTLKESYLLKAKEWFAWYHGHNINGVQVYDTVTTGCFDALNRDGVNLNQGAESILAYLLAYLAFCDIKLKTRK